MSVRGAHRVDRVDAVGAASLGDVWRIVERGETPDILLPHFVGGVGRARLVWPFQTVYQPDPAEYLNGLSLPREW